MLQTKCLSYHQIVSQTCYSNIKIGKLSESSTKLSTKWTPWMFMRSDCPKVCAVIPIFKICHFSTLLMMAGFSLYLWVMPLETDTNIFPLNVARCHFIQTSSFTLNWNLLIWQMLLYKVIYNCGRTLKLQYPG